MLVIESKKGAIQPYDKLLIATLLNISVGSVERIWVDAKNRWSMAKEWMSETIRKEELAKREN